MGSIRSSGCSFTVLFPFSVFPFYVTPKGNLSNNLNSKVESNEVCSFLFTKLIPDCL